jgi:hypothetical protein
MTLDPAAQFLTTDQVGSDIDELDINYITRKEVLLTTVSWKSTDAVGTVLWSQIVSPGHMLLCNYETDKPFTPPACALPALFFENWRGGFKFRFEPVTSAFHEGKLGVGGHPTLDSPPSGYAAATSQYYESHDIRNTNSSWANIIPFHSDTPWKIVWNGERLSATQTDNAQRFEDYAVGCVALYVDVALRNPNNVAGEVDINVYVSAAEDLEYNRLGLYGSNAKIAPTPGTTKEFVVIARHEMETDHNTNRKDDSDCTTLGVARAATFDMPISHFGETYTTLRECMKRYVSIAEGTCKLDKDINLVTPAGSGFYPIIDEMFRLTRGGYRFKLEVFGESPESADFSGSVTFLPRAAFTDFGPDTIAQFLVGKEIRQLAPPIAFFNRTQTAEFEIPYTSIYHAQLVAKRGDNIPAYYGNMFQSIQILFAINYGRGAAYPLYYRLWMCLADETRYGTFLGLPRMVSTNRAFPNPKI